MHTSVTSQHFDHGSKFPLDTFHQDCSSFAVENPHSSYMALEMTFTNKICVDLLTEGGEAQIQRATNR